MDEWIATRIGTDTIEEISCCAISSPNYNVYRKSEVGGTLPDDAVDMMGGHINPATKHYTPSA